MDNRQDGNWQAQAGRRRPIVIGAPETYEAPPPSRRWDGRSRLLLAGAGVAALFFLEAALSGTALITPINTGFLYAMRGLGALIGLVCGAALALNNSDGKFGKIMTVLFLPLMIGFLFDGLAWRMADWWEFGLSPATFSPASYPIKSIGHGRKGSRDSIEIDPFATGEATHIPVPPDQYRALFGQASDYCVIVQQRKSASGAIEIRTDGEFTFLQPAPIEVNHCGVPAANPWRLETVAP